MFYAFMFVGPYRNYLLLLLLTYLLNYLCYKAQILEAHGNMFVTKTSKNDDFLWQKQHDRSL